MKAVIITGASRGLGAALARACLERGDGVGAWARHPGTEWDHWSRTYRGRFHPWLSDLAHTDQLGGGLSALVQGLKTHNPSSWILIHNAAVVEPVKPLSQASGAELAQSIGINLLAPLILTGAFLRALPGDVPRTVAAISSGAGRKPYAGWAAYGAGKAGLDHLIRCAPLDQASEALPARFVSIAPGVVDTDMQALLRQKSPQEFPTVGRFQTLKAEGALLSPEKAAAGILALLDSESWTSGDILDLKDFLD